MIIKKEVVEKLEISSKNDYIIEEDTENNEITEINFDDNECDFQNFIFFKKPLFEIDPEEFKSEIDIKDKINFLSNSQVSEILKYNQYAKNNLTKKCFDYTEKLKKFDDYEIEDKIKNICNKNNFHSFEYASIINFCPSSYEEAIKLIPSLKNRDKNLIFEILDIINSIGS